MKMSRTRAKRGSHSPLMVTFEGIMDSLRDSTVSLKLGVSLSRSRPPGSLRLYSTHSRYFFIAPFSNLNAARGVACSVAERKDNTFSETFERFQAAQQS